MRNSDYEINHKTVQKLIGISDLKCKIRKVRYRSYRGEVGKISPYVPERYFKAGFSYRNRATDVTRINIRDEKIYLSPVLEMFHGEIVACSISGSPNMEMITGMPDKAFDKVKDTKGLILHSDQGWHCQHRGYRKPLERHGIIRSMSRKGNFPDNAAAENFSGMMEPELLQAQKFESAGDFIKSLKEYTDYYNSKRIKNRLDGKIPVQYRTLYITN